MSKKKIRDYVTRDYKTIWSYNGLKEKKEKEDTFRKEWEKLAKMRFIYENSEDVFFV